jgi:hypothetical protein
MYVRAAILVSAALLAPAPAMAETSNAQKEASALYERAQKAIDDGKKEEAAGLMRAAYFIHPEPEYVCNLGRLELGLGHGAKAANALTICIRVLPEADFEETVAAAKSLLASAKALAGTIKITANIPLADVFIGGVQYGKTPLIGPAYIDPGRHRVELRAPGYDAGTRILDVEAGTELDVHIDLKPSTLRAPPTPPPPSAAPSSPSPPRPTPPKQRKGMQPRTAVLVAGYGISLVGTAVGATALMAAVAAKSEGKEMVEALREHNDPNCSVPSGDDACRGVAERYDAVVGFTALGVGGIAVALGGGGLLAYELLRVDEANKGAVCAVLAPAAGGGLVTIKGVW